MEMLLAGSDDLVGEVVKRADIGGHGESVIEVQDGYTATIKARDADIVVIDLSIRGLGALGAISRICDRESHPKVIALDPNDQLWRRRAACCEGADVVLVWPQQADRLVEAIQALSWKEGDPHA